MTRSCTLLLTATLLLTGVAALAPTASASFQCDFADPGIPELQPTVTYLDTVCDATGTYAYETCSLVFAPRICVLL